MPSLVRIVWSDGNQSPPYHVDRWALEQHAYVAFSESGDSEWISNIRFVVIEDAEDPGWLGDPCLEMWGETTLSDEQFERESVAFLMAFEQKLNCRCQTRYFGFMARTIHLTAT